MSDAANPSWLEALFALGRFLYHISPALVAVVLGGLVVNRFFVRRANRARLIECLCDDIAKLLSDCADYWSVDYSAEMKADHWVREARIKGAIVRLNSDIQLLCQKYGIKTPDFCPLILELQEHCTGGEFESCRRKADRARYLRIVNSAKTITSELRRKNL